MRLGPKNYAEYAVETIHQDVNSQMFPKSRTGYVYNFSISSCQNIINLSNAQTPINNNVRYCTKNVKSFKVASFHK